MGRTAALGIAIIASLLLLASLLPGQAAIVRVKVDGNDANDGSSWSLAKQTLQGALSAVGDPGDEIWVAAGSYKAYVTISGNQVGITLKPGVSLYGGFAGLETETQRTDRNPKANLTVLDGEQKGSVITAGSGVGTDTVVDGFTIRSGKAANGGGINCTSASPTISNNVFTANAATTSGGAIWCISASSPVISGNVISGNTATANGGAIACQTSSNPTVSNNAFTGNVAGNGGAIYTYGSAPAISDNTFEGNNAMASGGAIATNSDSAVYPSIVRNRIVGNAAASPGGAIYCYYSGTSITDNVIAGNVTAVNGGAIFCTYSGPKLINNRILCNAASGNGGGVYLDRSSATILNNTLQGNAAQAGGAMYLTNTSSPTIANNIFASNSPGIYRSGGSPKVFNNCVWSNTSYDYSGWTPDPTGTNGNIRSDPLLADTEYGNVHIQPTSPCKDAGTDKDLSSNPLPLPSTDMDGQPRVQGTMVDIGADETDGMLWSPGPYVIVRVATDGDDSRDGSDWSLAKRTVQTAIEAASAAGGDVWVKAGEYGERITIWPYARIYGGFAGTETERSARDFAANVTTLSGQQSGSVVMVRTGRAASALSGFTIQGGTGTMVASVLKGGGVFCSLLSSPTISNNIVKSNTAAGGQGGGVYSDTASPSILDSVLTGNSATNGGAIACSGGAPLIVNNTIVNNTAATNGGAMYFIGSSSPTTANNIVALNTFGIWRSGGTPTVKNNDVWQNTGYNYYGWSIDPTGSNGNISQDPQFVAPGDIHIGPDSPCLDAGSDDVAPTAGRLDIDAQDRKYGLHVEIGADELVQVVTPVFSPDGGVFDSPLQVTITCASPNVEIRYTTDGSIPGPTSTLYTGPVTIEVSLTLKARAFPLDPGLSPSAVKSADYAIKVSPPAFSPDGGSYQAVQHVTMTCATPGATIRYTTDGSDPSATTGTIYSTPVTVDKSLTLKAIAYKAGSPDSNIKSAQYVLTVPMPAFEPDGGTYSAPQTVTISCMEAGATIRYTTDGTDPTETNGQDYTTPVTVDRTLTLKARAYKTGWTPSDIKSADYTINQAMAIAEIKQTGNGVPVGCTAVITKAFTNYFYIESETRECGIRVDKAAHGLTAGTKAKVGGTVETDPENGERYIKATSVETSGSGKILPLAITNKALGGGDWFYDSGSGAGQKGVAGGAGLSNIGLLVKVCGRVTQVEPNGAYCYVDDGCLVMDTTRTGEVDNVGVRVAMDGRAYANQFVEIVGISSCFKDTGGRLQRLVRVESSLDVQTPFVAATPVFSPDGGTYPAPLDVTITCATEGAEIHYTTDGAEPTKASPTYTAPVHIAGATTLKARAFKTGWTPSDIKSADYTIGEAMTIPEIKQKENSVSVGCTSVITKAFTDCFYIESDTRECGIRVDKTAHGLTAKTKVTVGGTVETDPVNGERYIKATSVGTNGGGKIPPIGMPTRALGGGDWFYDDATGAGQKGVAGGAGLNNIGLLVTICGNVTQAELGGAYVYVDDGAGLRDGTDTDGEGNVGVKIDFAGFPYGGGEFVVVTGISSCFKDAAGLHPAIKVESSDDIQKIDKP